MKFGVVSSFHKGFGEVIYFFIQSYRLTKLVRRYECMSLSLSPSVAYVLISPLFMESEISIEFPFVLWKFILNICPSQIQLTPKKYLGNFQPEKQVLIPRKIKRILRKISQVFGAKNERIVLSIKYFEPTTLAHTWTYTFSLSLSLSVSHINVI